MRVSSSAPTMSRRSVMQGLACGLAIAVSFPGAALLGVAASKLSQDAAAIERCAPAKKQKQDRKVRAKQLYALRLIATLPAKV